MPSLHLADKDRVDLVDYIVDRVYCFFSLVFDLGGGHRSSVSGIRQSQSARVSVCLSCNQATQLVSAHG